MLKTIGTLVVLIAFIAGCGKKDTCGYDECSTTAPANQIQAIKDYLLAQGITNAIQHCSGLFYSIDSVGTGKYPNACSNVVAKYTGRLTNGYMFDNGGGNAVPFSLQSVITGWREGIPIIRAGSKIRLYIPPALGYGNQANGPIPANSTLIFDVQLVSTD